MERRVRENSHARCGTGENLAITSKDYLSLFLCFDTSIDIEKFCKTKSAVYLILPEEDPGKFFLISLILQQIYRELLTIADENGGQLDNRVMIYADEIGTLPKIDGLEMMFSASRSRKISIVAIIQSLAQFEQKYGKEGSEIIVDNCQGVIFGSFAPNSKTAIEMSKDLGTQTVLSGSVSTGDKSSRSLQMIERSLMTVDELKALPKGNFIVMKTGCHPMRTKLPLFFKWGITFNEKYSISEKSARAVEYADKKALVDSVLKKYPKPAPKVDVIEEIEDDEPKKPASIKTTSDEPEIIEGECAIYAPES